MWSRSLLAALVASAVVLAGCTGDERETPDSPITVLVPTTVTVTTVSTRATEPSAVTAAVSVPPATVLVCPQDPDEVGVEEPHPPPCD